MAAREFGGQPARWQKGRATLVADRWLEPMDLDWQPDPAIREAAAAAGVAAGLAGDALAAFIAADPRWDAAKSDAFNAISSEI